MLLAVYLVYAVLILIFAVLSTYAVYRVFSMPHPYMESRIVALLFFTLSVVVLVWSFLLMSAIDWQQIFN